MTNSEDLDQTAPQEQSALCLHSFISPMSSDT